MKCGRLVRRGTCYIWWDSVL